MNHALALRRAACVSLSEIDDPHIREELAAMIARCDDELDREVT